MNKFLATIGLARRAGKLTCGSEAVLETIRAKKAKTVYICSDASDNTRKKLCDSCKYHCIEYCILSVPMTELSSAIGKMGNIAAVSISDEEMNKAVRKAAIVDGGCVYGNSSDEK